MTEQSSNSENRIFKERKYGYFSWKVYKHLTQELIVKKRNSIAMMDTDPVFCYFIEMRYKCVSMRKKINWRKR